MSFLELPPESKDSRPFALYGLGGSKVEKVFV